MTLISRIKQLAQSKQLTLAQLEKRRHLQWTNSSLGYLFA